MNFEIEHTEMPGVLIIHGIKFNDHRGFFTESFKTNDFARIGLPDFVQDNMSKSKKGVVRGLHWQANPLPQGKLVNCIKGKIFDVAVNVQPNSPAFGKHFCLELNEDDLKYLWIPTGYAHGFQALEEDSLVFYKVTNYWSKNNEKSINPFDRDLMIDWPLKSYITSEKDSSAPDLQDLILES